MPKIQLSEVKETLKERIKADNLISILRFVKKEKPSLWGTTKKKGHLEKSVLLAIYKDVEGKGYTDLLIVPNIGWATALGPSCITPKHSVRSLPNGGADQVIIGEQNDWEEAAEGTDRKGPTKDVNLWMDSTDFALRGPCEDGKKDQYHSYKLDSKGRYQGIMDSNTRFRALYGGYSPKVHDSQFCEINKHSIKKDFKGGVIVADQHYQKFGRTCSDPKFVTPVRSPNKKKKRRKQQISLLRPKRSRRRTNKLGLSEQKWNYLSLF